MVKMQIKFQQNNIKTINEIQFLNGQVMTNKKWIISRSAPHMLQNIRIESVT